MSDGVFFVASKLFWLLAKPESILVALVLIAAIFRARLPALLAATVMLAIGMFPVSDWLVLPLEKTHPANPDITGAAGLIVLGGASQAGITEHWDVVSINEHGERFLAAMALLEDHPELEAIFTGGSGSLRRSLLGEADAAKRILLSTGLAPERLRVESESRTTWENAILTHEMLGDEAAKPWVLVTSAFHMPRSVEVFCAAGWEQIIPYPADYLSVSRRSWPDWSFSNRLTHVNIAAKEWIGLIAYRMTGRAGGTDCVMSDE